MNCSSGVRLQYFKLALLSFVHFLADSASSSLPGFLPVVMHYFGWDLSYGVVIISTMGIFCNLLQIPAACLGKNSTSPIWIKIGLLLVCSSSLIGLFPQNTPFPAICLLMVLTGAGIAIVHPAGLRGVQTLHNVPSGMTTPLFMTGGFLGCAISPWVSGMLTEAFGLKGLLLFPVIVFAAVILVHLFRIRLAVGTVNGEAAKKELFSPWSFWSLVVTASLLNCGTTSFSGLVPYMLNVEKGFSLSFGGFALLLFGVGSSLISIYLGWLSSKLRVEKLLLILLACGIPCSLLFFLVSGYAWGIIFALLAGGLCSAVYPLFVGMSKTAAGGYSLGMRMGLMVGGTWGISGIVFILVGMLASRYSSEIVLTVAVPGFYLLSFLTALLTWKRGQQG